MPGYLEEFYIPGIRQVIQLLIDGFRERNFILCYLGTDDYGLLNRRFLAYFCVWKYVWWFEKERSISIEELKSEVFGNHWWDESWHEVLLLIAGLIDAKFVGEIIEYLRFFRTSYAKLLVNVPKCNLYPFCFHSLIFCIDVKPCINNIALSTNSAPAFSGDPVSNGGAGLYSINS